MAESGSERTLAACVPKVCYADKADLRFTSFADAAFPRSSGAYIVATQRVSSIQPFIDEVSTGT